MKMVLLRPARLSPIVIVREDDLYLRIDITLKDGADVTVNEMGEYVEYELGGQGSIATELLVRASEAIESVDVY